MRWNSTPWPNSPWGQGSSSLKSVTETVLPGSGSRGPAPHSGRPILRRLCVQWSSPRHSPRWQDGLLEGGALDGYAPRKLWATPKCRGVRQWDALKLPQEHKKGNHPRMLQGMSGSLGSDAALWVYRDLTPCHLSGTAAALGEVWSLARWTHTLPRRAHVGHRHHFPGS